MLFSDHTSNVFWMCEKELSPVRLEKSVCEFEEKVEGLEGVGVKIIKFLEEVTSTASGVLLQ